MTLADEATANVDPENEQLLVEAIEELIHQSGIYADFVNGRKKADNWKIDIV